MFKIGITEVLACLGIIATLIVIVLDKAGKLRDPMMLITLLAIAAIFTLPLALGNGWVCNTTSPIIKFAKGMLMVCAVGIIYSLLVIYAFTTRKEDRLPAPSPQQLITERFLVSVVVDKDTGFAIDIPHSADGSDRSMLLSDIAARSMFKYEEQGNAPNAIVKTIQRPVIAEGQERNKFYEELLQYKLVYCLFYILRAKNSVTSSCNGSECITGFKLYDTFKLKDSKKITGTEIATNLVKNKFLDGQDKHIWNNSATWLPVPIGTNISIPDKQSIILERPQYYRIVMTVKSHGSAPGVPSYLKGIIKQPNVETKVFIIELEARLEKSPSESKDIPEIGQWIRFLFDRLKKLGDKDTQIS